MRKEPKKKKGSKRHYSLLSIPILPYFIIKNSVDDLKNKRIINGLAVGFLGLFFLFFWLGGYAIAGVVGYQAVKQTVFENSSNNKVMSASESNTYRNDNSVQKITTDQNSESIPSGNQKVYCQIHERCGGGNKYITQDECNNLFCCFLDDGSAKLMNKYLCDNYYNNQNTNNLAVLTTPSSAYNCKSWWDGKFYELNSKEACDELHQKETEWFNALNQTSQVSYETNFDSIVNSYKNEVAQIRESIENYQIGDTPTINPQDYGNSTYSLQPASTPPANCIPQGMSVTGGITIEGVSYCE